jgi:hypothetical protein
MGMGTKWIEYKGKKILYQDYRGLTASEVMETLELTGRMMTECPTRLVCLSNVENMVITSEFMTRSKELGKQIFDLKSEKTALVGINGLKRIFYEAYIRFVNNKNKKMATFETETEAMDWLVS